MPDAADRQVAAPDRPGRGARIAGAYDLAERIGQGGMGEVFRGLRVGGGQPVAVKLLSAALLADEAERQAFLHECETLAQLRHPHILTVLDYGVHHGLPFLVTELCTRRDGRPFSLAALQVGRPDGRVDPYTLDRIFPQVCWALAYIHQLGLVHRDLKPENVLLQEDRYGTLTAKLGDFGLAGLTRDPTYAGRTRWVSPSTPTAAPDDPEADVDEAAGRGGSFSGTYDFMSPEQQAGQPLDARSDVFSLGVLLYRAATGYDRLTFLRPSQVVSGLPAWVDDVVVACAAGEPADRPENALDVLFRLPADLRPAGIERSA